ncbi:class I SAM-dependent methyltransferase [Bdellovibrio sp. HCB337]|uniref:class I SAM-dependent methyltransferase n=1 Tax=Bdellovibrio sp. HCB337 TaxID=3394358 RepID=UPI0039A5C393
MTTNANNLIESKEAEFHDQWASEEDINDIALDEAFQRFTAPENSQIVEWLGDPKGLKILELGAGLGEASLYFAKKGAEVTATDISPGMLKLVDRRAQMIGCKVNLQVVSANELTNIADNSFDVVYAANLLHHVDIQQCIREAHRVLKPGGRAFFWDPVDYNPVVNIYRAIATKVRTEDEHPLKISDLKLIRSQFGEVETKFYWLSAMIVFIKFVLINRYNPNKVRYWKKILKDYEKLKWLRAFHTIDQILFKLIPPLKWWAWNITIRAVKKS